MRGAARRLRLILVTAILACQVFPLSWKAEAQSASNGATLFKSATQEAAAVSQPFLRPLVPGRDRPLPEAEPPPNLDFSIQAPRHSPVPRAVEELVFQVKDVAVNGVTAYRRDEIRPFIEPLVGKSIHLAELIAVAEQIEGKYRGDGYILSRVYVPTQSVNDGVFQIAVIEGYVAAVSVIGGDPSTNEHIEAILDAVRASKPLKLSVLEEALLSANQLPGATASGLLRPSATEAGASDLVVTVKSTPFTASVSADNRGSHSSGRWTFSADSAFRSPVEDGGQWLLSASTAAIWHERHALQAKYTRALGGVSLSMSGLVSHGEPAGASASAELVTDSVAIGPRVSYPIMVTRAEKLSIDAGITYQSANVRALGQPFNHDEWRVADVAMTYQNSDVFGGISNATVDVSQGLPFLGATKSESADLSRPGAGRTDFHKVSTQIRHIQPIDGPLSAQLSLSGQYSPDSLLVGEEASFGGAALGRGYDPAAISGDKGAGGSFELHYDLDGPDIYADTAQLYAFYDTAKVWVNSGSVPHDKIASVGTGVRTVYFEDLSLAFEVAHVLDPVASSDNGKRSTRFLFNGSVKY